MTTRTGELRALTGARGIAAWFVVLFHIRLSIARLPPFAAHLFAKGYLAVDFFFLLSGFVIWLSWGERLHADRWAAIGPFLRKRIARIWPLHAVMLAATVTLALLLAATGRTDPAEFPFADLPLHVLLLQDWGFTDRLAWNVPSWSISAELGAYLVFPLVAIAVDWRQLSTAALLALAGILILSLCVAIGTSPSLSFDITHFGLVRCLCEFMTGTIVCALWRRGDGRATRVAVLAAIVLAGLWVAGAPETIVGPACFAVLLYVLADTSTPTNPFGRATPHFLGEVSYATYLCHYPLWIAFKLAFVSDVTDVPPILILSYMALVLLCSTMLYRHVERPAQRWIDRLGRSPKAVCAPS